MSAFLYGLYDSRDGAASANPFYVGVGVKERHLRHWREFISVGFAVNPRVKRVFMRHLREGVSPVAKILAICPNDKEFLSLIEKNAIRHFGRNWHPDERGSLCNNAIGGNGPSTIDMSDPEIRKNISEGVKRAHAKNPAMIERIRENAIKMAADPKIQERRRQAGRSASTTNWTIAEIREKRVDAMRGVKKTVTEASLKARLESLEKARSPEALSKISKKSREKWSDPEYRNRMSEIHSVSQKGKPISEKKRAACIANAQKARAAKKCA